MSQRRTVWKYTIGLGSVIQVPLQENARYCGADAAPDAEGVDLWYEVDPEADREWVKFVITGTSHPVPERPAGQEWLHVASCRHQPTQLVWHVWRSWPEQEPF